MPFILINTLLLHYIIGLNGNASLNTDISGRVSLIVLFFMLTLTVD